ncbi:transcriptional regulator [Streptomyces sp. Ru62]|uniref:helix-turn-helix transcriptional regulator n=1 Tax=Streptomyces sp. Ru62 TaxID=2080745 RepID=UPI000CDE4B75|nr:helix-turn-helix transcriptional regulator [Streptomyces sp. Ru62]POX58626.1 transcriptional regulator [Streptomyces sp. Ru62]
MVDETNTELRDFLRSRRAKITPDAAGVLPSSGPRRVPGLRREEVAQLADVSVDYYVRLERGRHVNVSATVLESIARALRLNDLERAHLFRIAKPARNPARSPEPQRVRPGLRLLLDSITDVPALVLGRRMDILAGNHLARALYSDFEALPVRSRNMARLTFLDDYFRSLYVDWENAARGIVASLRLYAGRHPRDPVLAELVEELSLQDEDFRRWWADHDVFQRTHGTKHLRHPVVGDLVLGYEAFTPVDDPEQTLGMSTAEPGSPTAERLALLARWAPSAPNRAAAAAASGAASCPSGRVPTASRPPLQAAPPAQSGGPERR